MDYTLQLHGEKIVYPVPQGLYELLTDITREVLRFQPKQIIPFIAEYLQALLITREAAKDAIQIVDDALDNELMKFCVHLKTSPEKVIWAVRVIQRALRRYFARRSIKGAKKGKHGSEKQLQIQGSGTSDKIQMESMSELLRRHNITFLQAHYAAIAIQKAWRGYQVRKSHRFKKDPKQGTFIAEETKPNLEKYAPSWANSWLTVFETADPSLTPFPKGKIFPGKHSSQVYLPRRDITVQCNNIESLFHKEREGEDDFCAECGSLTSSQPVTFAPYTRVIENTIEEYQGENFEFEGWKDFELEDEQLIMESSSKQEFIQPVDSKISSQQGSIIQKISAEMEANSVQFSSSSAALSSSQHLPTMVGSENISEQGDLGVWSREDGQIDYEGATEERSATFITGQDSETITRIGELESEVEDEFSDLEVTE